MRITFESQPEPALVHRVRNFAEDLSRLLNAQKQGSVPNMDSATNEVLVVVAASRDRGSVLRGIRSLLLQHNLAESAHVVK